MEKEYQSDDGIKYLEKLVEKNLNNPEIMKKLKDGSWMREVSKEIIQNKIEEEKALHKFLSENHYFYG